MLFQDEYKCKNNFFFPLAMFVSSHSPSQRGFLYLNDLLALRTLLIPNVSGEGPVSCMPLISCSLTWPALLVFFCSAYQSFYSTEKGQMQLF